MAEKFILPDPDSLDAPNPEHVHMIETLTDIAALPDEKRARFLEDLPDILDEIGAALRRTHYKIEAKMDELSQKARDAGVPEDKITETRLAMEKQAERALKVSAGVQWIDREALEGPQRGLADLVNDLSKLLKKGDDDE